MLQTINATIDVDVDTAIVGNGSEIILVDDALGKGGEGNFGKFGPLHLGGGEKEILDVHGHEASTGSGNSAVEQALGLVELSGAGGDIEGVVDLVATYG